MSGEVTDSYKLIKFIETLINYRQLIYEQDPHNSRICQVGLPQGSPLSPILYIIYTAQLEYINNTDIRILQFADDFVLYQRSNLKDISSSSFQQNINKITDWLSSHGLQINPNKSTFIIFSKSNKEPMQKKTIQINDNIVFYRSTQSNSWDYTYNTT